MEAFIRSFRTNPASHEEFVEGLSSEPLVSHFRIHPAPTPAPAPGSFQHDLASGNYQQQWTSWQEFQKWLCDEQAAKAIELRLVNTNAKSSLYTRKLRYVCSRAGTGGEKEYVKAHPEWNRKRGPKRTACKCSLVVKEYPGTSTILGNYCDMHNHPLGDANLPYTQIPKETREYTAGLLRLRVAPDHILKLLHRGVYEDDGPLENDLDDTDDTGVATRAEFIELRDIQSIQKDIEAETVRLHPDDGQSSMLWVKQLRAKGHLLGFKSKTDPVPPGSNLAPDCITYFLKLNRLSSPLTICSKIMSDFNWSQINSCCEIYWEAWLLLCWWHVLHAWQQHFSIPTYPELWEVLKRWIRIIDKIEFDATWVKIQAMAPQVFTEYLTRYWMPERVVKMWSAVYRTDRTIYQQCDTNMLIESYRHQEFGYEGPDIEVKKRHDILERSRVYSKHDIQHVEDAKYIVPSKTDPSKVYDVDIDTYTCTCLDFPLISFCKHICAV
ncbi:hypothetical protein B0H17DRAFT_951239 [Mycena rosella]|uniref:SWIM-type domain-containing protein n=1 Tax=Mycena rosella TaxID=1033263 RepID=A0AAD7CVR6_MYCRO|nr:hypothetical protein B0H17DRAFT_951239 [Mycena rosella]